jgi:nicotinamidase-related amidase
MGERVWDRFLTEDDRLAVEAATDRRVGLGSRPALLLVDLYRSVFGDQPLPLLEAVGSWPASCGLAAWEAIPHLQRLLVAARSAAIPIVFTTGLGGGGITAWATAIHRGPSSQAEHTSAATDRAPRRYEIIDDVAPLEGELVLHKAAPSAFWGTPLIAHLTYLGIDTLLVGGESTSGCVRATVVDAASHRLRATVVEECVFDRHEAAHAMNLFDMHQKYADVLSLSDVLAYLGRISAREQSVVGSGAYRGQEAPPSGRPPVLKFKSKGTHPAGRGDDDGE